MKTKRKHYICVAPFHLGMYDSEGYLEIAEDEIWEEKKQAHNYISDRMIHLERNGRWIEIPKNELKQYFNLLK